jgi:hypothetical protein
VAGPPGFAASADAAIKRVRQTIAACFFINISLNFFRRQRTFSNQE